MKPTVRSISAPTSTSVCLHIDCPLKHDQQQITHCTVRKQVIDQSNTDLELKNLSVSLLMTQL